MPDVPTGREDDVVDPEHLPGDLLGKGDKALADLDAGTGDRGDAVLEPAPRRRSSRRSRLRT